MSKKIWLSAPHMGGEEIKFVTTAFETNWIAPLGPNVNGFENDLVSYTHRKHAAALTSGTAAIHLGLTLVGVSQGDYVLCQSFTFCGSANPIKYLGAKPVFIDSEMETWNMDPVLLEKAIVDLAKKNIKPKAMIPVHLYGMPAKIQQIEAISAKYEIPIIEDAAEALGSTYKGKNCGNFGDLSVLSFNGNKIITTSGGGALLGNNAKVIEKARFLATQARDNAPHYEHSEIGYNYRLSNISAGIGRGQMIVLDERVAQRRAIYKRYERELEHIEAFTFLDEPSETFSNRWLSAILVNPSNSKGLDREAIRLKLETLNIESRPLWKPMHMQPVFKNELVYTNGVSELLFANGLCLPSASNMSEEDQTLVIDTIKGMFA